MDRVTVALCLMLAAFRLDLDPASARACVELRAVPDATAAWCVQAPPVPHTVARVAHATLRGLGTGIGPPEGAGPAAGT